MSMRRAWQICGWCTRQSGRALLWSVWLLLLLSLAGQAYFLTTRTLPVPDPVRRLVDRRLAEHGLRFDFERSVLALDGRLLLEKVRVSQLSSTAPLLTAESIYLDFDPWDLLVGAVDWKELRVSGLDLHLPPLYSATASDELVARDLDFTLSPAGSEWNVSHFTGYIGDLPVTAAGRVAVPAAPRSPTAPRVSVQRAVSGYLQAAARLQEAERWLDAFGSPRLEIALRPSLIDLVATADTVDLRRLPGSQTGRVTRLKLATRIPGSFRFPAPLRVDASARSIELPAQAVDARDITLQLRATAGGKPAFDPESLELAVGSGRWRRIDAGPLVLSSAASSPEGPFQADASLHLAGSAWRLTGEVDPRAETASAFVEGFVDQATLAFVGPLVGHDLDSLLVPAQRAPLAASARFAPGWKLANASGRLHSGAVLVHDVPLDETGAEFTYDGARVLCENLVLRQGESLAHGTYEMDTRSNDFRFLLTGGLRPLGISGWFFDWWTRFWNDFDFTRGVPLADVDVRGRWGDPTHSQVFVYADGEGTGLRGVPFDRVRTRLFLRPHWFDILHFDVAQANQSAEGRLVRALSDDQDDWLHMDFAAVSTLPLATLSTLFKDEAADLLEPYAFETPPKLRLSGRVDGPASPSGKHEHIDIDLSSTGPMTYHGFPLSDLQFEAALRDDTIEIPTITVGFAEGRAHGRARLVGPENSRRLSFDMNLADANVGAVTRALDKLPAASAAKPAPASATAASKPAPNPAHEKHAADAARQRQQRLDELKLVLTIAAEGDFNDPFSYKGTGRAAVTGPELAQLNLFGPLSEALRKSVINLGSFSFTTADAPFSLHGERVRFENLRIAGPSALIQADGDYLLRGGDLDFTAKIRPFEESSSVVGSAVGLVLTPLSKVFEVKLQGTLAKPSWIFSYGPSRLLNTITGAEKKNAGNNTDALP